jgi:hypothetical protein
MQDRCATGLTVGCGNVLTNDEPSLKLIDVNVKINEEMYAYLPPGLGGLFGSAILLFVELACSQGKRHHCIVGHPLRCRGGTDSVYHIPPSFVGM